MDVETCRSLRIKQRCDNQCIGRPGSSVGIVTGYGLDGPGIESIAASVV
jgi:hypothetical protein